MSQKKYTSIVTVRKNGKPWRNCRVTLEFTFFLGTGGFTDNVYTNFSGVAEVKHNSEGEAKVYVDGNHSKHQTTFKAPGICTVDLYE